MNDRLLDKLKTLADAAKYDVSCSSSGSKRDNKTKGLGDAKGMGICHSYTEDGRCVSLLKILLTNYCIYDCAYCISRRSNDVKRAAFTVEEVVSLTMNFYRRNYIEGLFLSSGIFKNADYTMERLVRIAKDLRLKHNFNGYIHLKAIPEASETILEEAGLYADRLSINMEIPSEEGLKKVAPEKNYAGILKPMNYVAERIHEYKTEKKITKKTPLFSPGGQSTQLVVGATPENDQHILHLASNLYAQQSLKRVYYSAYVPVSTDNRLPIVQHPPTVREHRIYQADWLMRFYGFQANEIANDNHPDLDLELDPKLSYALRHPEVFPIEINTAAKEMLLRIPGIGPKSVQLILSARKRAFINFHHLKSFGIALNRAQYFITCKGKSIHSTAYYPEKIRQRILMQQKSKFQQKLSPQLQLF